MPKPSSIRWLERQKESRGPNRAPQSDYRMGRAGLAQDNQPAKSNRLRGYKGDRQIHQEPALALVLSSNVVVGHQVAHLLSSICGWQVHTVKRDRQAYAHISQGRMHAVIADIDTSELGGLPVLVYTRHHWPSVITYAIARNEDTYAKQLAFDMAGCEGFFFLTKGNLMIDTNSGFAAQLQVQFREMRESRPSTSMH